MARWHELPLTGQPVFIVGSQLSEHNVTPGICPLEPSFNMMVHKPPGPVHVESAVQNSMQVEMVDEIFTHKPPAAQSLLVMQL